MKNSNVDENGSKIAETKIKKPILSKAFRTLRMQSSAATTNKNHCPECGFRIRGANHLEGNHHNGRTNYGR